MTWATKCNADPTAGVTLFRRVLCPRCGRDKGPGGRRGLCSDCVYELPPAERLEWAA